LSALAALVLALQLGSSAGAATPPSLDEARSVRPQLILIHGGSFLFEDPTFESRTSAAARAAGFVPHYLRYPLADMPAAVLAARAEAARLRARYGRNAVYAYGTSAGGTLAALLAGDGLVSAAVAKAPISDLLAWEWPLGAYGPDYFERIGMTPEARRRLSPLRRRATRPLLIVHGRGDRIVPLGMSRGYAVKFTRVRLWVVGGGHYTERARPELLRRAFAWLARVSGAHQN
jgi:pimeloyl-ACP methyl ester carboxylesterase